MVIQPRADLCDKRADEAAAEAKAAKLGHERERALRSEAAWRAMAVTARKVEEARAARSGGQDAPK
jgi:hypothetical protein